MEKINITITIIYLIWILAGCGNFAPEERPQGFSDIESAEGSKETESEGQSDEIQSDAEENREASAEQAGQDQIKSEQTEGNGLEAEEMSIVMKIGDESSRALAELLREQPMSIQMSMYGGFEQVGSFGISLPRDDKQTTTQAGDIVLYSGNQMVVFYGSNSWAYTRLGRITDKSAEELKEMLGSGNVTITLELGL